MSLKIKGVKKIFNGILAMIFPDDLACKACGKEAIVNEYSLCDECMQAMSFIEASCVKCGKSLENTGRCRDCGKTVHIFDRAVSVCEYEGSASRMVKLLKFNNQRHIAPVIARLIYERLMTLNWQADMIIPVPMHKKAQNKRGFNQTLLVAMRLSELSGVPYCNALVKMRQTREQAGLERAERLTNLNGAFALKADVKNKRIIVLDDVYTTGATMDACAKVLKENGAANVYGLTFLSGKGK